MARSPHKARSRHKLTDAEREQRRRRDRERLAEAIGALFSSEGWKAWLRTRATLHGYSLRNTYLIAQEARRRGFEPTHVAGFRAWLKLGRVVRKGEPGLAILAPPTVKRRDSDGDETGDRRTFFRTVHVWDTLSRDRWRGGLKACCGRSLLSRCSGRQDRSSPTAAPVDRGRRHQDVRRVGSSSGSRTCSGAWWTSAAAR
jgi:hypothetical protein